MGLQQSKVTTQDRAILDMKLQRDKLRQFQKRLQVVSGRESDIARQCLHKNDKRRALLALKQKKYQETLLQRTDEQLATLEQLASNIEFALIEKDVLFGLQRGAQVLKEINKEMSMEKVERLIEDSAEGIAYQQEIGQLLGDRMTSHDEEDVLAELALMENEIALNLPSAPSGKLDKILSDPNHVIDETAEARVAQPAM